MIGPSINILRLEFEEAATDKSYDGDDFWKQLRLHPNYFLFFHFQMALFSFVCTHSFISLFPSESAALV